MPNRPIRELADLNFTIVARTQSLAQVRESLGYGQTVVVVDDADGYPLYVLSEETVMAMEEEGDFSVPRAEWPRPTLTDVETPVQTVLVAMVADAGIRWQLLYDENEIVGVVSPQHLFAVAAQLPRSRGEAGWPAAISSLGLPKAAGAMRAMAAGRAYPLPPGLCFRCPGDGDPHRLKPGGVNRSVAGLPLCPTHDLRLAAENPCRVT